MGDMTDFVGGDPESQTQECPAVWRDRAAGGFYFRGKTVTDPTVLGDHIAKGEDESDIWLPGRMAPIIREALDGYEEGRQGPGEPTFEYLLEGTERSLIRFEMRDEYDASMGGFEEWKETGDISAFPWGDFPDLVRSSVARGVTWRRVRVISEPVSDYIAWEHACTVVNIEAGEDIRWLPRTQAGDLMLPGADCWVFDHRIVRWNYQRGDNTNPRIYTHSSDPRIVRDIVGAFEIAWDRAIPHADYKPPR